MARKNATNTQGGLLILKLWILSDMHERVLDDIAVRAPDFDVFVCAGDMVSGNIARSIEMVATIACGKPSVFVAGNHEWAGVLERVVHEGRAAAERCGVHWLELDTVEIDGLRFAGATLWTPLDVRFGPSVMASAQAKADVVVTHFPPSFPMRTPPGGAKLWICGHHHGFADVTGSGGQRLIRNALGYGTGEELLDSAPAREDFVVEIAR